jgi:putative flippase GtrA
MNLISIYNRYRNLILYILIGFLGAAVDYTSFVILYNFFQLDKQIAQIVAAHLGFINNFIFNAIINFKAKTRLILRFLSYYFSAIVGIILRATALFIFTDKLNFNTNLVQFLAMGFVVTAQFIFNKYITFHKKINE